MARTAAVKPSSDGSGVEGTDGNGVVADSRADSTLDGISIVNPADLASAGGNDSGGSGEPGKRKRGRPAGSGNGSRGKPTTQEVKTAVSGIQPLLLSLHRGVAGLLRTPEFALEENEAKLLAENMANVASQYSVEVNPKYVAWLALLGCLMAIYGPRFGAIIVRNKVKGKPHQEQPEQPQQGNLRAVPVQPFVPPQSFTG